MKDDLYQSQIREEDQGFKYLIYTLDHYHIAEKLQSNKYMTSIERDKLEEQSKKAKPKSSIYQSVYKAIKPSIGEQ